MLESLHIAGYALIDDLKIDFGKGLNIFTGATGAGKTIIVGALGLVAGGRGGENMIRTGDSKITVEAQFSINDSMRGQMPELAESTIILKREISRDGKNKAFLNGKTISLSQLKAIGAMLVSITSQHQQKGLLDTASHRNILDEFAGLQKQAAELNALYLGFQRMKNTLSQLKKSQQTIDAERELLQFQISEIDAAMLKANEEAELESEKQRLIHAETIRAGIANCRQILYDDADSASDRIAQGIRELSKLGKIMSQVDKLREALERQSYELKELELELSRIERGCDPDPARLEIIEERLIHIKRLKRKYGQTVEDIDKFRQEAARRLAELDNLENKIAEMEAKADKMRIAMSNLAASISSKRAAAARLLEKETARNLAELSMAGSEFKVQISQKIDPEGEFIIDGEAFSGDSGGIDMVEFLICANPGEGLKPLASTASGGELSRILLAICSALNLAYPVDTMVFDEIDSGISGEVASAVAKKLQKLSRNRQVICVTHLQQIASRGDAHYRVYKGRAGGRAVTRVKFLDNDGRIAEIARLISGEKVSEIALEGAAALLEEGGEQQ